jgi:malonate-semialdehyde dehydrogenase (acetylating) / methylmalonate-semialdehyde dehydrogenase
MAPDVPVLQNLIGGTWAARSFGDPLPVPDPATGRLLRRVPVSGPSEVSPAVAAARSALPGWRATPAADRARILRRLCSLIEGDLERISAIVTQENGKTLDEARGSVRRGLEATEFAVSAPTLLEGGYLPNVARDIDASMSREPIGVVAGITPFNFPAMIPLWMAPLAIACGNTFILKPSERVPSAAERLVRLFEEAGVPPGVLNLLHGGRSTVELLLDHPGIDAVAFVGSAPVARTVYARGTASGKRVLALAGAKNHAIVLPDAPILPTVESIVSSAFGAAGERCLATSVVVAVGAAGDPISDALAERVRSLRSGPGDAEGTDVGPLIRAEHRDRIEGFVRQGLAEGAKLIARGIAPPPEGSGGYVLAPALFDHVRPEMAIAQEEIFGPVLSVIRAADLEEAVRIANASGFGNAASIYTADGGTAREFVRRIEAGMVGINLGVPAPPAYFPLVGWKGSVFGVEAATGRSAVSFYTRTQVVLSRWPRPSR